MAQQGKTSFFQMDDEHFKRLVAVSIALVTVLVAIVTYLQSGASALDDQANRDSKRYSVEAFGGRLSGNARVNFDDSVAYQTVYEMQLLANLAESRQDAAGARRYRRLAEEAELLSPLTAAPYLDPQVSAEADVARYESDVYLVNTMALAEKFAAASAVKGAWDYKANTYIFYLTLLALSLFMFGLSATVSNALTRWFFYGAGAVIAVLSIILAINLWSKPVFDLRQQGNAIADYSTGVGLLYQEKYPEAIAAFGQALQAYPQYTNALVDRGEAYLELKEYARAIEDYKAARKAGDQRAFVAGNLAWAETMQGNFQEAIEMNRLALKTSPDELWIQFDLGLSQLAAGQEAEARATYASGMEKAARWVAEARATDAEPPSFLWWSLEDAAQSFDALQEEGAPARQAMQNPEQVAAVGQELATELKNLALALEYTGNPPPAALTATVSPLRFAEPLYDDQQEFTGFAAPASTFAQGIKEVGVQFDFAGLRNGQEYVIKLLVDGVEDPSWRMTGAWEGGESGTADILLSYAYSEEFSFTPGEYTVELYVDYRLAASGDFRVEE